MTTACGDVISENLKLDFKRNFEIEKEERRVVKGSTKTITSVIEKMRSRTAIRCLGKSLKYTAKYTQSSSVILRNNGYKAGSVITINYYSSSSSAASHNKDSHASASHKKDDHHSAASGDHHASDSHDHSNNNNQQASTFHREFGLLAALYQIGSIPAFLASPLLSIAGAAAIGYFGGGIAYFIQNSFSLTAKLRSILLVVVMLLGLALFAKMWFQYIFASKKDEESK